MFKSNQLPLFFCTHSSYLKFYFSSQLIPTLACSHEPCENFSLPLCDLMVRAALCLNTELQLTSDLPWRLQKSTCLQNHCPDPPPLSGVHHSNQKYLHCAALALVEKNRRTKVGEQRDDMGALFLLLLNGRHKLLSQRAPPRLPISHHLYSAGCE